MKAGILLSPINISKCLLIVYVPTLLSLLPHMSIHLNVSLRSHFESLHHRTIIPLFLNSISSLTFLRLQLFFFSGLVWPLSFPVLSFDICLIFLRTKPLAVLTNLGQEGSEGRESGISSFDFSAVHVRSKLYIFIFLWTEHEYLFLFTMISLKSLHSKPPYPRMYSHDSVLSSFYTHYRTLHITKNSNVIKLWVLFYKCISSLILV